MSKQRVFVTTNPVRQATGSMYSLCNEGLPLVCTDAQWEILSRHQKGKPPLYRVRLTYTEVPSGITAAYTGTYYREEHEPDAPLTDCP